MAEEEKQEQVEETEEGQAADAEEAPAAEEEEVPAAEEAAAEEAAPEEAPPSEGEAPEEAAGEAEESAGEAEAAAGEAAGAPAAEGEVPEALTPKQRRKLERSRFEGEPGPARTPEERAAERAERRSAAGAERRRYRAHLRQERSGERGTGTPPAEGAEPTRKVRLGRVTSSKADKTITVRIESARRHATYEKVVRRGSTLHAHDERNEAGEGDVVRVVETRPMSRSKRWRLLEIVERAR